VLEQDELDVNTRFLLLGGNSLRAMKVLALAQEAGFEFELKDLFAAHSTIAELSRR
jgi:hypothetical protein